MVKKRRKYFTGRIRPALGAGILLMLLSLAGCSAGGDQEVYGIVVRPEAGVLPLAVRIPGVGDVSLPFIWPEGVEDPAQTALESLDAEELFSPGDLVRFTLPRGGRIDGGGYPLQFQGSWTDLTQEDFQVVDSGLSLTPGYQGDWRFTVPLELAGDARPQELLEIYVGLDGTEDAVAAGQKTLASVPVLQVDWEKDMIWVELDTDQVETFLEEYSEGRVACRTVEAAPMEGTLSGTAAEETALPETVPQGTASPETVPAVPSCVSEPDEGLLTLPEEEIQSLAEGRYPQDCVFYVNRQMNRVQYEETEADEFLRLLEGRRTGQPVYGKLRDGRVVWAGLDHIWQAYGIGYEPMPEETFYTGMQELLCINGTEVLGRYYAMENAWSWDVGDGPGTETVEICTGFSEGAGSSLAVVRDPEGQILDVRSVRAEEGGQTCVYLGYADGLPCILTLYTDVKENSWTYAWQAYRLDEDGEARQIAGSRYEYEEGVTDYEESIHQEWFGQLENLLEGSRLVLTVGKGQDNPGNGQEALFPNGESLINN